MFDSLFSDPEGGILGSIYGGAAGAGGASFGANAPPAFLPSVSAAWSPSASPSGLALAAPAAPAPADAASALSAGGQGAAGGASAMAGVPGSDFLARLAQSLRDNSSMLMAFGGGTMTGGLGRGFQAAAASAADANSRHQAPQTVKLRQPGGGEALMMWDPVQRRYVPAPGVPGAAVLGSVVPGTANATYREGATATNQQGQRFIVRNGQW
jgi:hypothetical protein